MWKRLGDNSDSMPNRRCKGRCRVSFSSFNPHLSECVTKSLFSSQPARGSGELCQVHVQYNFTPLTTILSTTCPVRSMYVGGLIRG